MGGSLRHQHVDGIDIRGISDLRDHDGVERLAAFFHQRQHVAIAKMRVEPVDADGDGLAFPVDLVQRLHDIVARGILVGRRHRILEVETNDIGRSGRSLLEQGRPRARHEEFGAIKSQRRLPRDGSKAHRKSSHVTLCPTVAESAGPRQPCD